MKMRIFQSKVTLVGLILSLFFIAQVFAQPGKKVFHKAITNLKVVEFSAGLKQNKSHTLLDVRSKEEFSEGHLPNALNINVFDDDFKTRAGKLDKAKPLYVYCYAGGRSEEAADILAEMGFTHVVNMLGGYRDWAKAGLPVEK